MTPVSTASYVPPRRSINVMDTMCKCGHVSGEHVVIPDDTLIGPPHIWNCMDATLARGILGVAETCACRKFEAVTEVETSSPDPDFNAYYGMLLTQWQELREHMAAVDRLLQSVTRMAGPR